MPDHDIRNMDDIRLLVDTFYGNARQDDLLGPIFEETIGLHWPEHFEKLYRFWQTVLLNERTYHGRPFVPHASMPLDRTHFERWLGLFHGTVDSLFAGPKAEEAKWRSLQMANAFHGRIQTLRATPES